jgi:hypothetical protein
MKARDRLVGETLARQTGQTFLPTVTNDFGG